MKTCDGCNVEFDDSVELFPRLIVSKEAQAAKRLAEKEGEEMLCLGCWLESVEGLEKKQLATLLLSMLQRVTQLQQQLYEQRMSPMRQPSYGDRSLLEKHNIYPYSTPSWTAEPPFKTNDPLVIGISNKPSTTISSSSGSTFLAGQWAKQIQQPKYESGKED